MRLPTLPVSALLRSFALALVLAGCGGSVVDGGTDSNEDDSDDSSDSSDDGSYDGSDGSDGSEPGDGSSECRGFDDEESAGYFEIEIVNSTSQTLYLGQDEVNCTQSPFYTVTDATGASLVTSGGDCFASCADYRDGKFLGCPAICRYPSARRLAAGESTRVLWDARSLETRSLPERCSSDGIDGQSCQQWRAHADEKFTFSARAFSELDCTDTLGDCSDDCDEADGGGCDVPGALVTGSALVAVPSPSSEIDTIVTLVFEDP